MRTTQCSLILERPKAPLRVLFLHHAGGSSLFYLGMARSLPEEVEPHLFDLGGRGVRDEEAAPGDFASAVAQVAPAFTEAIDRPVVIVGHSLGALLAHSLVSSLDDRRQSLISRVVVSAFPSPGDAAQAASRPPQPFLVRTRKQVREELRSRGGCPPEVFEDAELLESSVDLLGKDLHLADTYDGPIAQLSPVPYEVWYGENDEHLTESQMARWAEFTENRTDLRSFPGGHFYLTQETQAESALHSLLKSEAERAVARSTRVEGSS